MTTLWLVGVVAFCAGLTTATDAADGATIGVLYDTERGRQLAETLVRSAADVNMTSAPNCAIQVTKFREAGVHRFVSLCQKTPVAGNDLLVTAGACPAWQSGCRSLHLPASSQWRVLAALVSQLQLPRVLLAEDSDDGAVFEAMQAQGVQVVPVSPISLFTALTDGHNGHNLSDPAGSVAVVQQRASLLPALQWLHSVDIRAQHWFVPGLTGADAQLTEEERALLGDAHVYTAHTAVEPTAKLPEVPANSSLSELALALDGLAVVRGADGEGLTGPLALGEDRARVDSFAEVLLHRPQDGGPALPPRAGDWVPVAAMRGGALLPPSVQYVLPSILMPQLSGDAGCAEGRMSVTGTDAVVGRAFRREFAAGAAPRLLLVYGSAPFLVSLECSNITSDLHCGADDPATCTHLERTFHPFSESDLPLSRHARDASAHQYGRASPAWRAAGRRGNRAGRAGYSTSQNHVGASGRVQQHPGQFLAGVNRAGGYDAEPAGAAPVERKGHAPVHPPQDQDAEYSQQDPRAVYERRDSSAAYHGYVSAPSLRPQPGYRRPEQTGLVAQGPPSRRQYAGEVLTKQEVLRVALSDIFGCLGSLGGCGLCLQYFATFSATQPENCYAACALGIGGSCSGAIGSILSQVLDA